MSKRRAQQRHPTGKVMVGYVYSQNTITPQWDHHYRMVLARDLSTHRRIIGNMAHQASGVHIPDARCDIVRKFLADPRQPEWLWFIDTDATFADDTLERLLAVADPKERPIVGALAFGVRVGKDDEGHELFNEVGAYPVELFPTVYTLNEDGTANIILDYPPETLVQCHSTGCHCLLIHRSVLEDERWEDGHPLPWFRVSVMAGKLCSEDQFFCIKAGSLGYPIHVDTRIKTGHVKTFVADEMLYRALRGDDGSDGHRDDQRSERVSPIPE